MPVAGRQTAKQRAFGRFMVEMERPWIKLQRESLDPRLFERMLRAGKAAFQGTPPLMHYNPLGSEHGDWYAALIDAAVGCAAHTRMPVGRDYTHVALSLNTVRGASHATGPLRAIATVIHCSRQLVTAEGRIVGPGGKQFAHATRSCLVFDLHPSVRLAPTLQSCITA